MTDPSEGFGMYELLFTGLWASVSALVALLWRLTLKVGMLEETYRLLVDARADRDRLETQRHLENQRAIHAISQRIDTLVSLWHNARS